MKGDYEYCLKCGKYTKAKHIATAKHNFWRRDVCRPVLRLRQYLDKQHIIGFDEWWHCKKCEAKGPELNKKFCTGYTHKRWNAGDEDNAEDPDQDYPGEEVRRNAYIRMLENYKDKVFHNKEEAESKRRRSQADTKHDENEETDTQ
jgi:hypothetical protein